MAKKGMTAEAVEEAPSSSVPVSDVQAMVEAAVGQALAKQGEVFAKQMGAMEKRLSDITNPQPQPFMSQGPVAKMFDETIGVPAYEEDPGQIPAGMKRVRLEVSIKNCPMKKKFWIDYYPGQELGLRQMAVEMFNKVMGLRATEHAHEVVEVKEETSSETEVAA